MTCSGSSLTLNPTSFPSNSPTSTAKETAKKPAAGRQAGDGRPEHRARHWWTTKLHKDDRRTCPRPRGKGAACTVYRGMEVKNVETVTAHMRWHERLAPARWLGAEGVEMAIVLNLR